MIPYHYLMWGAQLTGLRSRQSCATPSASHEITRRWRPTGRRLDQPETNERMTQFEQYRWEDRVLRKGSWKFNLAMGAVAFGVLTGACLDSRGRPWAAPSVS